MGPFSVEVRGGEDVREEALRSGGEAVVAAPRPAPGPSGSHTVGRGRLDLTGSWSVGGFSESVRDGMPSGMLCGV